MNAFWNKKKDSSSNDEAKLTWTAQARAGLEQTLSQAPVPKALRGKVKKELMKAAEEVTRAAGQTEVTAEHLMQGMLAKMPSHMRDQIEQAMQQGPEALKNLEKKLRR